jgi:hypothetical protein
MVPMRLHDPSYQLLTDEEIIRDLIGRKMIFHVNNWIIETILSK